MIAAIDTRREVLGTHVAQSVPILALGGILPFMLGLLTDSPPRIWVFFAVLPLALRLLLVLAHHARSRWTSPPMEAGHGPTLATAAARTPEAGGVLGVLWVVRDGIVFRQGDQMISLRAAEIARVELVDPGSLRALLGVGRGAFPLVVVSLDGQEHRFAVDAPVTLAKAIRAVMAG